MQEFSFSLPSSGQSEVQRLPLRKSATNYRNKSRVYRSIRRFSFGVLRSETKLAGIYTKAA